jgi:uncharacterized protein (TIGR03663 family)
MLLYLGAMVVIVGIAMALRLPGLTDRPMHTDEAVHAYKVGEVLETGHYVYDPNEYHGPTIYQCVLPLLRLQGATDYASIADESRMRLVIALFGIGLVILILLVKDALGIRATLWAGLLTAVSPALVFYSRYYIQEMLLVVFCFTAIAAGYRYIHSRNVSWAVLAGTSLGLMVATKETAAIALGAMVGAIILDLLWQYGVKKAPWLSAMKSISLTHLVIAAVCAGFAFALIITHFFSNPENVVSAFRAPLEYAHRAISGDSSTHGANVHDHPWHFYMGVLLYAHYGPGPWWSEALILVLAVVGMVQSFRPQANPEDTSDRRFGRFLTFYTLLLILVYSVIPYKTPWCLLGFLHGLILLAGMGATKLAGWFTWKPYRVVITAMLILGCAHLAAQAHRSTTPPFDTDMRNPYVYGHTSRDALRMVQRIKDIAVVDKLGYAMPVHVVSSEGDYWPLPWYLREFTTIGYWQSVPDALNGGVIVASPDFEAELDSVLKEEYQKEYYGLRPEVLRLCYIRMDLWERFIESRNTLGGK